MPNLTQKTSLSLIDLDHQAQLNSLKNYLKSQEEFKDYDFNSSSMSVLLDILSFNTVKNAFYYNMIFSERWLDSAQLRSSLFSQSKELNYLPRSKRSAVAKVKVNFTATGESQPYILQKGSPFSTLIKSKSYTFTLPETLILSSTDNNFEFETEIYEGIYVKDSYIFKGNTLTQFFEITNKSIDTKSLTVTVFEDGKEVGDTYILADSLLGLSHNSKVFFLQTSQTGGYEIYFGNNILGKKPKENALIILDYRISNGKNGNGGKNFSVDFDPTSFNELTSSISLEVIEASKNGEEEEDNESIRYYAPRHYQVQERAVVNEDYEIILRTRFPEINSIAVFGGEELEPPAYSRVFISIDINEIDGLPESKKNEYYNFLKERSLFGKALLPNFIEPEIIYINIDALIRYNLNVTTNSINRTKAIVVDAVNTYNKDYLNDFNSIMRKTALFEAIKSSDDSLVSIILDIDVYKILVPKTNISQNHVINFGIPFMNDLSKLPDVYEKTDRRIVYSSEFLYGGSIVNIEDDNDGTLRIIKLESDKKIKIIDIGTVDYDKGIIKLNNLIVSNYFGNGIKFFATPKDEDIKAKNNNIMKIHPDDIKINVEPLRE